MRRMRIGLRGSASPPRKWSVALAEQLAAQGHEIVIDCTHPPSGDGVGAGLSLLFMLERLLYGIAGATLGEPAAWPAKLSCGERDCDLAIDFAGEALSGPVEVPTLTPLYAGIPGEVAGMDVLLEGKTPLLSLALRLPGDGQARSVATVLPAIEEPRVFVSSLDRVLARMGSLIARVVARFAAGRLDDTGMTVFAAAPSPWPIAMRVSAAVAKNFATKIELRLKRLVARPHHWRVGWRRTQGDEVTSRLAWPAAPYAFVPDDGRRFYTDPFIFWHDGVAHVFCEEYPYGAPKGVISTFTISPDGTTSAPRIVLERPYHLSYPMVFARDGAIFMIPETSSNRSVELYRAARFPDDWVLDTVMLEGFSASDATLVERDGRLWMFLTLGEEAGSSWDMLGLFHARGLAGPWEAHAGNPVVMDASAARPAGLLAARDGELIRPAQDCTGGYGSGISLFRVDRLDPDRYTQTLLAKLGPQPAWHADGTHTVNAAGGLEVIDVSGWRSRGRS